VILDQKWQLSTTTEQPGAGQSTIRYACLGMKLQIQATMVRFMDKVTRILPVEQHPFAAKKHVLVFEGYNNPSIETLASFEPEGTFQVGVTIKGLLGNMCEKSLGDILNLAKTEKKLNRVALQGSIFKLFINDEKKFFL
jgi:hypothetical protein